MVPRGEVVQGPVSNFKFAIVSAVDTITLENLSQQAEDVAVICAKLNITYDDFLCNIFEQIIKCVFMMHKMKIAHRNIRPCNIVYKDHKWKLANFHYALEYDKMIDFYEIVGDDKFIYLELQRLRKRDNYYKKVKQNLLFNDLYAVYMCFRQLALPGESKICQLNQTILAISSLDGLE
jgi:serine/threonine protein kinase